MSYKPKKVSVIGSVIAGSLLGALATFGYGCDGGNGSDADTDTDTDSDTDSDTDTDTEVFTSNIPADSVKPADGSTLTPEDGYQIGPQFEMPQGDYENGTGEGSVTGDNTTPSDTADDWSQSLGTGSYNPGDTVTLNTLDLTVANTSSGSGAPVKDGEKLTFDYKATSGADEETATSTVTMEGDFSVPTDKIAYCEINNSIADGTGALGGTCYAQDAENNPITPTSWDISCDGTLAGRCGISGVDDAGFFGTSDALTTADIGIHNIEVSAMIEGETKIYSFAHMVDPVQSAIIVDTASESYLIRGNEDYISSIATACFDEFDAAQISGVTVDTAYQVERSTASDGQTSVDDMFACISDAAPATSGEAPLLGNYLGDAGRLPEERLTEVAGEDKTLVGIVFYKAL